MASKKMAIKDLSSEIEQLKKTSNEKDDMIKALNEKFSVLQSWAHENFASICKKMSETDQHHFKNEKILEQKISDLDTKLVKVAKIQEEEDTEEPCKKRKDEVTKHFKCRECSFSFTNKVNLKKHIMTNHPKTVKCDSCEETFEEIWRLEVHMKTHSAEKHF